MSESAVRQIGLIHPLVLAGLILLGFPALGQVLSHLLPEAYSGLGLLLSTLLAVGLSSLWYYAVRRLSLEGVRRKPTPFDAVFYVVPFLLVLFLGTAGALAPVQNAVGGLLAISALAYVVGVWRAAAALERADPAGGEVSTGRIAGSAILLFYLPIGAWLLRKKIRRIVEIAQPVTEAAS